MMSVAFCAECREVHAILAGRFACPKARIQPGPLDAVRCATIRVEPDGHATIDVNWLGRR